MTRIAKKFSQHIAIILCIFILLTTCSFVFKMDGRNGDTQFFAARIFLFFYPVGRQSLSNERNARIVSWFRAEESAPDKQSSLIKNDIFSEANTDMPSDSILYSDSISQSQGRTRKYYLRI